MNLAEQKELALKFLNTLEHPDQQVISSLITDDFEFEMMARMPGVAPMRGKAAFAESFTKTLKTMFPNGLNLKMGSAIAEGPHVAIQAESNTTAANGKKYANRYHFYFLFRGDKIAQVREYNDSNHVREVFMS